MNLKPSLQVALDTVSLEDAFRTLAYGLGDTVDIIEVGTMLLLTEGLRAVDLVRSFYPKKQIVADFKCIGAHFGSQILKHDPNLITVSCHAEYDVAKALVAETKNLGKNQQIQVELHGDNWSFEDIEEWKKTGAEHIIYGPKSRSAAATGWNEEDVVNLNKFCQAGWIVTAAGGVTYEVLELLAGIPLFAIICGKSILKAQQPAAEAVRFMNRIDELWTN